MNKVDFDSFVEVMLESNDGISDLVFTVGRPLQVEAFGKLVPVHMKPDISELTPFQCEEIALYLVGSKRKLLRDFLKHGSCDTSYGLGKKIRFRVNVFRQRGHFGIVMRKLVMDIPTVESLQLPALIKEIPREKNGLVLVTGATGSGKTTTLASVLNLVNMAQPIHIVTLEDPIEFVHENKEATFTQRELGQDFDAYPNGIRAALRQAPKIILVGEMRDRETVEAALTAAETGHLVLSTLHTIDAGQSINRILGMFSEHEQTNVRIRLADTLRYVASQRLAPKIGGGRCLIAEIMGHSLRTRELVELGETEDKTFREVIDASSQRGWVTFDQSVTKAFEIGDISEETALDYASSRGIVQQAIDTIKKTRGGGLSEGESGLQMDVDAKVERY